MKTKIKSNIYLEEDVFFFLLKPKITITQPSINELKFKNKIK